ncbi:MAG: HD domain-containing protein [Bacteroidetes bacterium]|nr:HD domain-containing protein [Bacteroidota bacterium]
MAFTKIFNDPVYGFVSVGSERVFRLVEHRWFQRLRRIQQLGLGSLVYPGAIHTRFQHALGAMHLMDKTLGVLSAKGHAFTEQEREGAAAAILLHDIGHGPFSHALEKTLVPGLHHEGLSLAFMRALEAEMGEPLTTAMAIFSGKHPKRCLHELVNSQLDVDRLDYLTRDTYFTGVHEGQIGTNRILDMLDLAPDGGLVVEAKGIYSIEKFIVARRIMYWQVYLHKTVLCAEQMLIRALARARELTLDGQTLFASPPLLWMLQQPAAKVAVADRDFLEIFAQLDDSDIWSALKVWSKSPDKVLALLATALVDRRLFGISMQNDPIEPQRLADLQAAAQRQWTLSPEEAGYLVFADKTANSAYNRQLKNIRIRYKDGRLLDLGQATDELNMSFLADPVVKHYLCYPKNLSV